MKMNETKRRLALAYDSDAERRASSPLADWKLEERELFLNRLIGAGMTVKELREKDWCEPKRLFVSYTDEALQKAAAAVFDIVEFRTVPPKAEGDMYFQRLLFRKREHAAN